jgi:hypothetical protein
MSHPAGPPPDIDPFFVPGGYAPKGDAKCSTPGDEGIRYDLLPTEAAFRVAGTAVMVLAAAIFVVSALPVSAMLRRAGEPGGLLLDEGWLLRRWVARVATVLTLAVLASVMGWGLRRRHPWARWALIVLGAVPPLALVVGIWLRALGSHPALREFGEALTHPCVGLVIFASGLSALQAACSRRGRVVLSPHYDGLVARTPKLSPSVRSGLLAGLGLAWAAFFLYWTLVLVVLCLLAAGVIRSP